MAQTPFIGRHGLETPNGKNINAGGEIQIDGVSINTGGTLSNVAYLDQVNTFSEFPVTPSSAPTTDYQVANKKYVDNSVGTTSDDFAIGDGTDTDKTITANNGDANEPQLKYDSASSKWQYSNDGTTFNDIGSGGSGSAEVVYLEVNQVGHGFDNDFVYNNGTTWVKAQANSDTTTSTHFAVRIDDDNFQATIIGEVDVTGMTDDNSQSLTTNTYYFLSQTVAGKLATTEPTTGIKQVVMKTNATNNATISIEIPFDLAEPSNLAYITQTNRFIEPQVIDTTSIDALKLERVDAGGGTSLLFENGDDEQARIWLDGSQNLRFEVGGNITTDTKMLINSSGNIGIGTGNPSAKLEILDTSTQLILNSTASDLTNKDIRFGAKHYTNAEEPVGLIFANNTATANDIRIGGGTSVFNAATSVSFYTASNTTTTDGTQRAVIDSNGRFGIGTTSPAQILHTRTNGISNNTYLTTAGENNIGLWFANNYDTTPNYAGMLFDSTSDLLKIFNAQSATNHIVIDNTGKVTIGSSYSAPTLDNEVATKKYVDDNGGGSSNFTTHKFTTTTTWNALTGLSSGTPVKVEIEAENLTVGSATLIIDGADNEIVTAGNNLYKLIEADSSVSIKTGDAYGTLAGVSDSGNSYDHSSQSTAALGLMLSKDGLNIYITGSSSKTCYQYTMTAQNDLSTASYSSKSYDFSNSTNGVTVIAAIRASFMGDNDTKVYVIAGNTKIYQFNLSVAGDISTASYSGNLIDLVGQLGTRAVQGLWINDSGTRFYVSGHGTSSPDVIYQYSMTTSWDLSTSNYTNKSYTLSGYNIPLVSFNQNETIMYLSDGYYDIVHQYDLSVAGDVSTASDSGISFDPDIAIQGSSISYDGSTYFIKSSTTIHQYDLAEDDITGTVLASVNY